MRNWAITAYDSFHGQRAMFRCCLAAAMAFLMMTRVGAADASSLITTSVLLTTLVPTPVLGAVTQRSEQCPVRRKGITTDKTQICAWRTTLPPADQ
jgi:hypothetical protein